MNAHDFLVALTIILGVAAVTTVLFQKLHQPVVLGYILAGFLVGPNFPIPLVVDRQITNTLSELGVILVMFSLGLEFSFKKLLSLGASPSLTALFESSLMIWLGFLVGRLFGWSTLECLFTGAIIAISSTTIIAKAFDEKRVEAPLRNFVVGILVVEDLVAVFIMTALTAIATGTGLDMEEMAISSGRLVLFLGMLVGIGLAIVPRGVRLVRALGRPETSLVFSIGLCFAVSLLANAAGYSVALGAFIAGSLIAESGQHQEIERLVEPVRDMFAAIFFVSVGLSIEPSLIAREWRAIVVLSLVVMGGKILGVSLGGFFTGNSVRKSVRSGMSLAQIGEFSFIIAGLGLSLKATRPFLYIVAVAVSAITTLTTPWLIAASGPFAELVDRKMPRPIQTFVALYGSWLDQLRGLGQRGNASALRRTTRRLVFYAVSLGVLAIVASLGRFRAEHELRAHLGAGSSLARWLALALPIAVATPLLVQVVRVAGRLGFLISEEAFPRAEKGKLDLASAPRRLLVVTLQVGLLLAVGLPLLALTQPFLPGVYAPLLLLFVLGVLGVNFWRRATDFHGHVRASSEVLVEAMRAEQRQAAGDPGTGTKRSAQGLPQFHELLPGLGDPTLIALGPRSSAVGRSLSELNLRGSTGATVLAITREGSALMLPRAEERLVAGDQLAVAGSAEAVERARALLLAES